MRTNQQKLNSGTNLSTSPLLTLSLLCLPNTPQNFQEIIFINNPSWNPQKAKRTKVDKILKSFKYILHKEREKTLSALIFDDRILNQERIGVRTRQNSMLARPKKNP